MKSRSRAALSLFLSVALAFGTVPTQALAQMAEEASAAPIASEQQSSTSNAQAIFEWLDAKLAETIDNPAYIRGAYDALTTLYAGTAGDDAPQATLNDAQEAAEAVALACAARSIESVVVCDVPAQGDASAETDSTIGNAWNMVCLDGSWYHVDVLAHVKEITNNVQEADQHRYLLVSDETIRANDGRETWAAKDSDQTPVAQQDYVFAQPAEQPAEQPAAETPAADQPAAETPATEEPADPQPSEQPAVAETPATEEPDAVQTPDESPSPNETTDDTSNPTETPADDTQTPAVVPNEDKQTMPEQGTPAQKEKDEKPAGAYKPTSLEPQLLPESLAPNADSDFTVTSSGSGVEITGYSGSGGHVVIPTKIGGSTVVSIGQRSFASKTNITEVTIPATVTKVGKQAFSQCDSLTSLHLPTSGLTEIGEAAFFGTGLTSVSIPGCVQTLGTAAFGDCESLGTVQLANGLKTIEAYAFQYCPFTSINIPASVEVLGSGSPALSFYGTPSFTTITVDSNNANYSARNGILYNKTGTILYMHPTARQSGTFNVPNNVTIIANYAFLGCSGITEVVIPSSVTTIRDWVFTQSSVARATIPATVTEIGDGPFDSCYSLTEMNYLSSAVMPYRFCEGCYSLTSVNLGNSVTVIGGRAFKDCNLYSVYIPDSVIDIEFSAFLNNANLTTVTGAKSLKVIDYWSFADTAISSFPWGSNLRHVSGEAFLRCQNFTNPDYPSYLTKGGDGDYWVYDDNYTLGGTCDYNMASEVLQIVNQERSASGLSPLSMDSELQEAAMRRAAECSLYFSHSRPNGSDYFALTSKASGENIAAGSSTAEGVMDQWMDSPGHRSNILTSSFKSIGVGCFQVGAMYYWVQMFGGSTAVGSAGSGRRDRTFDTDVLYSIIPVEGSGFNLNEAHGDPIPVISGSTKKLTVGILNPGWDRVLCPVHGSSFTWTSSNPSVASVDPNGTVTAGQQAGVCTITATSRGGYSWSIGIESRSYSVSNVYPWADGLYWYSVFDVDYYASQNPDVRAWAQSGTTVDGSKLFQHFINNGMKEGRRSKSDFDVVSYYNANADLRAAFGGTADLSKYYRHYVTNGYNENRKCTNVGSLQGSVVSRDGVDWSPVYDRAYYAQQNDDVARWATRSFNSGSVVDDYALLQHFVNNGAKEGRRSKASFDLASYFNAHADLRTAFGGTTDLSKYYRHYAAYGANEGRRCSGVGSLQGSVVKRDGIDWSPVYDRAYYAQYNGDVAGWATRKVGAFGTVLDDAAMLQHFVNNGAKEGRKSKESFELASYYNANADLRRAFGTSDWSRYYRHYVTNGQGERRTCKGVGSLRGFATASGGVDWAYVYDANEYASRNADLANWARRSFNSGSVLDDAALLSHFVNNGQREHRQAKSTFNVTNYRNRYADLDRAFGDDWPRYYRHYATNGCKENRNGA